MIDLICIDVDGTLVGSAGEVGPEVWEAVERARAGGTRFALCSGRPAFGLTRGYAERLDPDGWHVFQNGASVLHLPSGESRSLQLPAGAVDHLVHRARATGRVLELYTDTTYAVEHDADDRARRHAALLGLPFEPRELTSLPAPAVRGQWLVPHHELDVVLADRHGAVTLSPSTSPMMPDTAFIHVTPCGVDKGSAVRAVAGAYGIPLARVMMVGDGANDVAALHAVGHPVAMGNAEPEAREAARYEVGHVDEGGLLEALALARRL